MQDDDPKDLKRSSIRALRSARRNLRNPESKLALIMMAYQNAQEAGTATWALPEA